MRKTYILIDLNNLAHRARYAVSNDDVDMQIGMAFHVILTSVKKVWNLFKGSHVVFCTDGRSWRKNYSDVYKLNRKADLAKKTPREQESLKIFMSALQEFVEYLKTSTNATVLHHPELEADDLISFWIEEHKEDYNVIVSSDADFVQLLHNNPRVALYNGIRQLIYTYRGVYNEELQPVQFSIESSSKIKVNENKIEKTPVEEDWIEWILFLKCIRGDRGDNIFPAYPGARVKGTKNKVGIRDAFLDRHEQGFYWNNFMSSVWKDHNSEERVVKEEYAKNKLLIDLKSQPEEIKQLGKATINSSINTQTLTAPDIGFKFLKFCGNWDLNNITNQSKEYIDILKYPYAS